MDRPSGPLGAATQSTGRGLPENPAQGVGMRRAGPPMNLAGQVPPLPPIPNNIRNAAGNSTLAATVPMSTAKVLALTREMMENALQENEVRAQAGVDPSAVSSEMKPGVTIDLSRKNIQELPEEVVDVIKNELERLALSHNLLSSFPSRFAECTSLRYLNVRHNQIKDFPLPLCDLRSLEILDLGRNKLRVLPPEIVKLASLKVLSVQKNRIQELPLCLADMVSLQILKLEGNDIIFPPPEVFQIQAPSPPNEGILRDREVTEVAVTTHIKKYLRQKAMNGRMESDTGGDESSEGTETPRMPPIKRVMSGRFPIKINGTDMSDMRSPALGRPPPIPTRSHYRGLSQQSTSVRRPSVMPLTIGNVNERLRSNSETVLQARAAAAPGAERPESRSRRMGIVTKKASELATLDETQANNRFSHYRGLSHGSAMQGNPGTMVVKSPASPAEPAMQRPIYVRRLSILPERRRESKLFDPVIEAAKGILYSVFQIHPIIQMLMSLTGDGTAKRSSLEIVFYNTNSHVEELEQEIQRHDPANGDDNYYYSIGENENVHRACQTLVGAYTHVCTLLASNIETFVDNGDPRYIRTLLVLLYNSIMELRVTLSSLAPDQGYRRAASRAAFGDTVRPHSRENSRENSVTPTAERPGISQRARNGGFVHNPSNLRVATDVSLPYINGNSATATITSATPRSGDSFASSNASGGRSIADYADEDRQFEKIFLSLQKSIELVMRNLPAFNTQLTAGLRNSMAQRAPDEVIRAWKGLIAKSTTVIHQTESLKTRMSMIKLKDPGIRTHTAFWNLCNNFMESWGDLGRMMKGLVGTVTVTHDDRLRLRPIHQSIKLTVDAIHRSPWSYFLSKTNVASTLSPLSSAQEVAPMQLPMTPQSAALGPAVQATVPSTPQSASFSSAFSGGLFERADALISYGGLSMSRTGTMTTSDGSSFNTLNSFQDGTMTSSSSIMSPPIGPPHAVRLNGGKVAF